MTTRPPGERAYAADDAVVFQKTHEPWGELSNMAGGFPLVVAGHTWLTAEALYQACRYPRHPDVQRLILEQTSPMAAKMKSKAFRANSRSDWEIVRAQVMRWVLRVKLAQNFDKFGACLERTGERPIVERSHRDRYWGTVLEPDGFLRGSNVLGRLLMELRAELTEGGRRRFEMIEPPALSDFTILGLAIGRVTALESAPPANRLF